MAAELHIKDDNQTAQLYLDTPAAASSNRRLVPPPPPPPRRYAFGACCGCRLRVDRNDALLGE